MLTLIAIVLTIFSLLLVLLSTQLGVLVSVFSKPIIDATWSTNIGGMNLLQIFGVLFPAIIIARLISSKNPIYRMPFFKIWLIYIIYNIFTFSFIAFDKSPIVWLELAFRVLNGLAGFYMLQAFFVDRDAFRRLLVVFLLAGLFPMGMGLYQAATGAVWQVRTTVGLVRSVGVYHDAVVLRMFVFQTLTAIILYVSYFTPPGRAMLKKASLVVYGMASIFVMYNLYSKAAVVLIAVWFVIWTLSFRRVLQTVGLVLIGAIVLSIYYNEIASDITQLFSKEIESAANPGNERDFDRTLGGRWYGWNQLIEGYAARPLLQQIIGTGNPSNAHNDYLAKLLSGGIVGVFIYLWLLTAVGWRIVGNWWRRRTPLDVIGFMIFIMLLIDSIGIHTGLYTTYQWYIWGFIGLALRGLDDDEEEISDRRNVDQRV